MWRRLVYNIWFLFMLKNMIYLLLSDYVIGASVDSYGDPRGPHENNFYDLVYDDSGKNE